MAKVQKVPRLLFVMLCCGLTTGLARPVATGLEITATMISGPSTMGMRELPGGKKEVSLVDRGVRVVLINLTNVSNGVVQIPTLGFQLKREEIKGHNPLITLEWAESKSKRHRVVIPHDALGVVELNKGETGQITFEYPKEWPEEVRTDIKMYVSEWAQQRYHLDWFTGTATFVP